MSLWAIGKVAQNYHDLGFEAGLDMCIRHRLSKIASSTVMDSPLHKIAEWDSYECSQVMLRTHMILDEIPQPHTDDNHNLPLDLKGKKADSYAFK
jgi:hypothetical protein